MARLRQAIDFDRQHKVFGNAKLARDFEAGACWRQIAHAAIDTARAVEPDAPSLERAVTLNLTPLVQLRFNFLVQFGVQIDPPSIPAAAYFLRTPLAVTSVRRIDQLPNYTRYVLFDRETACRNTKGFVALC
jgi:hypothetical protein